MALVLTEVVIESEVPDQAGHRRPVDVRIVGERIERIGERIEPAPGDEVVEGHGGGLMPGLHDHHVHLPAWAVAARSVEVGPSEVTDAATLADRLRAAPSDAHGWVRATGYHESIAGLLDRRDLDRLVPDRPLRVQHRSGALWILNTRALQLLSLLPDADGDAPEGLERDESGRPTGRLWRADAWLRERRLTLGDEPPDLAAIGALAAEAGVTGFTECTPALDEQTLALLGAARRNGDLPQRLHVMADPAVVGHRPDATDSAVGLTFGPLKVMLDDDRLPDFGAFVAAVRRAHDAGAPVAVHCVTRTQAAFTIAALSEAGSVPGDRMEHGAVLGHDLLGPLRALRVIVVSQPGFLASRGDTYLRDVAADDLEDLWRLGSLIDEHVPVALGSDAPFGPADPWMIVQAAAERRTPSGAFMTPHERLDPRRAITLFWGRSDRPDILRRVAPGAPADLVVLPGTLDEVLATGGGRVAATVVGGRVAFRDVS